MRQALILENNENFHAPLNSFKYFWNYDDY